MLIFVPVPAGNVPSQEKIRGGSEGVWEGGDLKLISHSYLETRGCKSSVQPSWCHSKNGPLSPHLGCEVSIWGQCALSSPSRSLQLGRSLPGITGSSKIRRKQQNSFRTEENGSPSLLDRTGISADWRCVRFNANSIKKTCSCTDPHISPADQASERRITRSTCFNGVIKYIIHT